MRLFKQLIFYPLLTGAAMLVSAKSGAQTVSLTTMGTASTQNFDALLNTGTTNNLMINGWYLTETGGGARDNEQYGADNGATNTGDTYSYGAAASAERALGGLRSGTLIPVFGASFTNNTGATITSIDISYTGEEWRLGTAARTDQLNFEYSLDATSLTTGTWTAYSALNFVTPSTSTVGARDGNVVPNRTALSSTISALSVANSGTVWIRWTDLDATGADDGLAVDDFSITPNGVVAAPEMNIRGNTVSIADGDVTPSLTDFTDFGSRSVCSGSVSRVFTIENTGTAALTLPGVPKVAVSGTDFTVSVQPTSPVAAAGTTTFTVIFDPSVAGLRTATLSIANNDADENPYTFAIQGTGAQVAVSLVSQTDVNCNGGATGSATVSATGGTPSYGYSWAPTGGTGATATGLTAGTYTCTVTDAAGCTVTQTATITEPPVLTASSSATAILCSGGSSTVTVAGSGGTIVYTGTGTFTVSAGTSNYTITDANGCTATTSITVTEPDALSASSSATAILCNGGTATVTVAGSGGTVAYTGTGTFTVSAGTSNYTITDANGCTATTSITVTQPNALSASSSATAILCNGGTATVTVAGSGGTAAYTGTGTFTVAAGTSNYTITDANGCTATTSITVTQPNALTASSSATAILCNGGSSTVTVAGSGGTAAYSGTGTFTVAAGTSNYTITDANGCTATTSITVTQPTALSASSSATAILCNGGSSTVTVAGSGGTAAYSGTGTFTVSAGTSNYTITDANGCTATTSITVTQPNALSASSSATVILCNGGTATVTVAGSGGTAAYSGTGTFTVAPGTYNYTITDANGCTATTSITVTEPDAFVAASSAGTIACNGATAPVTVTATGGTMPYTGDGTFNVGAGAYTYTVTDAGGCTASTSITISQPGSLSAVSSASAILCNGGTSTVTVSASGGTMPYTGAGTFTVGAGTYSYSVTDANGCPTSTSVTIGEPSVLTASSSAPAIACHGGVATINVNGIGGTAPYTGAGTFPEPAGTYNYTVTDANGCTTATSITLTEPAAIDVSTSVSGNTITAVNTGATGFQWLDCSLNMPLTGETNQSYTATMTGNYSVIVSEGACVDTSACVAMITTGIENSFTAESVSIYPNPAVDMITVQVPANAVNAGSSISVSDAIGKRMYIVTVTSEKTEINLQQLQKGIYFISLQTANGNVTKKIIKE